MLKEDFLIFVQPDLGQPHVVGVDDAAAFGPVCLPRIRTPLAEYVTDAGAWDGFQATAAHPDLGRKGMLF